MSVPAALAVHHIFSRSPPPVTSAPLSPPPHALRLPHAAAPTATPTLAATIASPAVRHASDVNAATVAAAAAPVTPIAPVEPMPSSAASAPRPPPAARESGSRGQHGTAEEKPGGVSMDQVKLLFGSIDVQCLGYITRYQFEETLRDAGISFTDARLTEVKARLEEVIKATVYHASSEQAAAHAAVAAQAAQAAAGKHGVGSPSRNNGPISPEATNASGSSNNNNPGESRSSLHRTSPSVGRSRSSGGGKKMSTDGGGRINLANFAHIIAPNARFIERIIKRQLVIPDWTSFTSILREIYEETKLINEGKVADYIPELALADAGWFGVSFCSIDGQLFSIGDTTREFSVQSSSKPICYLMALDELGEEEVHRYVGREPSGLSFNDIALNPEHIPHNPMVNAGAIMVCSLIRHGVEQSARFRAIMDLWTRISGDRKYVTFSNSTYLSERATADRNFCLGFLMQEARSFDIGRQSTAASGSASTHTPGRAWGANDLVKNLELYFQCVKRGTMVVMHDGSLIAAEDVTPGSLLLGNGGQPALVQAVQTALPPQQLYCVQTTLGSYEVTLNHQLTIEWCKNPYVCLEALDDRSAPLDGSATHDLVTVWYERDNVTGEIVKHMRRVMCKPEDDGHKEAAAEDEADADASSLTDRWRSVRIDEAQVDVVCNAQADDAEFEFYAQLESTDLCRCSFAGCTLVAGCEPCDCGAVVCDDHEHAADHRCPEGVMVPSGRAGAPQRARRKDTEAEAEQAAQHDIDVHTASGPNGEPSLWTSGSKINLMATKDGTPRNNPQQAWQVNYRTRLPKGSEGRAGGTSGPAHSYTVPWLHNTSRGGMSALIGSAASIRKQGLIWLESKRLELETVGAATSLMYRGRVIDITVEQLRRNWDKWQQDSKHGNQHAIGVALPMPASVPVQTDTAAPQDAIHTDCALYAIDGGRWQPAVTALQGQQVRVVYQLHNPLQAPGESHLHAQGKTFLNIDRIHTLLGLKVDAATGLMTTEINPIRSATIGVMQSSLQQYNDVCRGSMLALLKLGVPSVVAFGAFTRFRWINDAGGLADQTLQVISATAVSSQVGPLVVHGLSVQYVCHGHRRECRVVFAPHPCLSSRLSEVAVAVAQVFGVPDERVAAIASDFGQTRLMKPVFVRKPKRVGQPGAKQPIVNIVIQAAHEDDKRYALMANKGDAVAHLTHNCCSIQTTAEGQAVIGSTLASGGRCSLTDIQYFSGAHVRNCLSLMLSCGMYDYSGEWAYKIGLPAKSGVSGCLMVVIPNIGGLSIYSPALDALGNTVRGIEFCKRLVDRCSFSSFTSSSHKMDPSQAKNAAQQNDLITLCTLCAKGDLTGIRAVLSAGADANGADYDGRTPLHLAASEGQLAVVKYLCATSRLKLNPVDRWGGTPFSDAVREGHQAVAEYLFAKLKQQGITPQATATPKQQQAGSSAKAATNETGR